GLPLAARTGLDAATRSRVAVMHGSMRVVGDWLGRFSGHLEANPRAGALVPSLLAVEKISLDTLFSPAGGEVPAPARAGDLQAVRVPPAMLFYAARARMLGVLTRAPDALLGDDQTLFACTLEADGVALGCAPDVG